MPRSQEGKPDVQKARLLDALRARLQEEEELLRADYARFCPKAPLPQQGKCTRMRGQLWRWDWQARAYVLSEPADSSAPSLSVDASVEARVRSLVLEMAEAVGRMLQDADEVAYDDDETTHRR